MTYYDFMGFNLYQINFFGTSWKYFINLIINFNLELDISIAKIILTMWNVKFLKSVKTS